jgi:SAM-dependent methyltransferase
MNVFELGIGTNFLDVESNMGINGKPGASLRAWRDFFPNSLIYGADIDSRVIFEEERIKTFCCNQTDTESVKSMWEKIPDQFDIIVEDGLHKFDANVCFFENSFHKLKIGGHFIIEDIQESELNLWVNKIKQYENIFHSYDFNIFCIDLPTNTYDNNIIHIIRKN